MGKIVLKMIKKYRNEFKYFINFNEYKLLKNKLNLLMKSDENSNKEGQYYIRSHYFDDFNNSSLFDKQAGILNRKKYRVRAYNLDKKTIKLEKKSKINRFINKENFKLSYLQYLNLINCKYEFLLDINHHLAKEFYYDLRHKLFRPKIIIEYVREAYILNYNRIRITFDKYLKNSLTNSNLFDLKMPLINSLDENLFIIEIKFDNFLPSFIKSIIQVPSSPNLAISKYVISRKRFKFYSWEDQ